MADHALHAPPTGPPAVFGPQKSSGLRPAPQNDPQNKPADLTSSDAESPDTADPQAAGPVLASPPAEPPPDPRNTAASITSQGQTLSPRTRQFFESRFGHDFSGVRIVTDQRAQQLAADLNAQAFAFGSRIFFNQGRYRPQTQAGKHLLAHELSHVVQQTRRGAVRPPAIQRRPLESANCTAG